MPRRWPKREKRYEPLTIHAYPAGMRILVVGDLHGDTQAFTDAVHAAANRGISTIFQVGDFGYWEHTADGADHLDRVEKLLANDGITCVWLDGNHENHELLHLRYGPSGNEHDPTPEGFWTIRERLFYAPRGVTWRWGQRTFMALGGAYSVDQHARVEGLSWWPQEELNERDLHVACVDETRGAVDVLFTHDMPNSAYQMLDGTRKDPFPHSIPNRQRLDTVIDHVQPKLVVHGHMHMRYSRFVARPWGQYRCEGLACNGEPFDDLALTLTV